MIKNQTVINSIFAGKLQFQNRVNCLLLICMFVFSNLFAANTVNASFNPVNDRVQETIKGEWFIDFSRKEPDQVQLTMTKRKMRGDKYTYSSGVSISEIQGLSREQVSGAQKDVTYRIVREAGTLELEGLFREGKGAGFLTFSPNRNFVSALESRGYGNLTEDDLFAAATNDLSIKLIDDLKSVGYDRLSFKELVEADIFKLSGEYVQDLKSAGYENLAFKELLEARVFKIDSRFVKEMQAVGFVSLPLKALTEMRVYDITPEFVRTARNRLGNDLTVKQITDLKRLGIVKEASKE